MAEYLVQWEIDVEAEDEIEAAKKALEIQRDPDSMATVFEVSEANDAHCMTIDLSQEEYYE